MREIKFRAWSSDESKMIYPSRISFMGNVSYCYVPDDDYEYQIDTEHLMQYAGIKDKHGVEVYDQDIYRNLDSGLIGKFEILTGVGGDILYCTEYKDGRIYNNHDFARHDTTNFEVIGNIYDNPELVQKS